MLTISKIKTNLNAFRGYEHCEMMQYTMHSQWKTSINGPHIRSDRILNTAPLKALKMTIVEIVPKSKNDYMRAFVRPIIDVRHKWG